MAEKDVVEKTLESYNDVFADIINVLIFKGKRKIKPDDLINATARSQYKLGRKFVIKNVMWLNIGETVSCIWHFMV